MTAVDGLDVAPSLAPFHRQFDMPESASLAELFVRGIGVGNVCGAVGDLAGKSPRQGRPRNFSQAWRHGRQRGDQDRARKACRPVPQIALPSSALCDGGGLNLGISAILEREGGSRFRRLASRRTDDACHPTSKKASTFGAYRRLSKAACDKFPRICGSSLCEKSSEETSAKF